MNHPFLLIILTHTQASGSPEAWMLFQRRTANLQLAGSGCVSTKRGDLKPISKKKHIIKQENRTILRVRDGGTQSWIYLYIYISIYVSIYLYIYISQCRDPVQQ